MTVPLFTIHGLAPDHVAVELHDSMTAPLGGLELHLALHVDRQRPIAWWLDEWGRMMRRVEVGEA